MRKSPFTWYGVTCLVLPFLFINFFIFADIVPEAVYLTWRDKPQSSIFVQWITLESDSVSTKRSKLKYKAADNDSEWKTAKGSVLTFPAHPQYLLNRVKIEGLETVCKSLYKYNNIYTNE